MTDTIIKGTGNSRNLKSVPNFLTLYPNFEAFAQALVTGTLPVDLSGLQAGGVDIMGTDYSKGTCLPDSVEQAIWGSVANRNIGQALSQLRSLITSAQNTANGKLRALLGGYVGDGATSKTIYFSFTPKVVIVSGTSTTYPTSPLIMLYGVAATRIADESDTNVSNARINISWGSASVTWSNSGYNNHGQGLNLNGYSYNWLAIG